jgi:hypothetical protein
MDTTGSMICGTPATSADAHRTASQKCRWAALAIASSRWALPWWAVLERRLGLQSTLVHTAQ